MLDPDEGATRDGRIRTGARRDRVPPRYEDLLAEAAEAVEAHPTASLYLYGSVATGQAVSPTSDVDLLTIDLPPDVARATGRRLTRSHATLCRGVEVGAATTSDFVGDDDESYGGKVFLHHYCVHLAGPDRDQATSAFPADARAARGFNGDIALAARRWRSCVPERDPARLGRAIARKTLLAMAGIGSIRTGTWSTDRRTGGLAWTRSRPEDAPTVDLLLGWSEQVATATPGEVRDSLDGIVSSVVATFEREIGLWPDPPVTP